MVEEQVRETEHLIQVRKQNESFLKAITTPICVGVLILAALFWVMSLFALWVISGGAL